MLYVRPKEKPLFKKNIPAKTPATKPGRPIRALRSPLAILSSMVVGHPTKINAPIIMHIPNTNLVNGAEPPFTANSFLISEIINTPRINPGISGLIYWPLAKLWNPRAPEISLKNQAVQSPKLNGFPNCANTASTRPKSTPKMGILSFLVIFSPPANHIMLIIIHHKKIPCNIVYQYV
jgi:hypothetical protein